MKIQKLIILFCAVFAIAGVIVLTRPDYSPSPEILIEESAAPKIIAIGDSITVGVGASFIDFSYVNRVSDAVDVDIINEGVNGDTSRDVLARLPDIIAQDPDIAILFIGGNDAIQGVPASNAQENIISIVNQLEESGIEVLLLGAQDVPFGIQEYADIYIDIVKQTMVASVPNFFDGILDMPELLSDPIHPNDQGYEVIANRVEPILQKILEQ